MRDVNTGVDVKKRSKSGAYRSKYKISRSRVGEIEGEGE